jgi:hypothetical protein
MHYPTLVIALLAASVAAYTDPQTICNNAYNACRVAPDANMSTCASNYAGCLKYNPFDSNGSLNGTAPSNITTPAYTTTVVTAITTYCPDATILTYGSNTYTVPAATYLTITDCPCTLTLPVATKSAGVPVQSVPVSGHVATASTAGVTHSPTPTARPTYTAAADANNPAFGLLALGLFAFF